MIPDATPPGFTTGRQPIRNGDNCHIREPGRFFIAMPGRCKQQLPMGELG